MNALMTLEWYTWAQLKNRQIACSSLSYIHFCKPKNVCTLCIARQKLGFIQDNWREQEAWEESSLLSGQRTVQKGIWEAKQTRTNFRTRKVHLRKVSIPIDLCCGCRSLSEDRYRKPGNWNLHCLVLFMHTEVLCYFPKPLRIQYIVLLENQQHFCIHSHFF